MEEIAGLVATHFGLPFLGMLALGVILFFFVMWSVEKNNQKPAQPLPATALARQNSPAAEEIAAEKEKKRKDEEEAEYWQHQSFI